MSVVNRKLGAQRNKLKRYQLVLDELSQHNTEDIPMKRIWAKHIYPKFGISITTLYTIIGTPVKKELEKVEMEQKQQQLMLFD